MTPPLRRALVGLGLIAVLTGCSQAAAISPVGSRITAVRFAVLDMLVAQRVDLMQAPVCLPEPSDIRCTGNTIDNRTISAVSLDSDPSTVEITVAGASVYRGSIQDVLDANARPSA